MGARLFDGNLRIDRHERSSSQFALRLLLNYGQIPLVTPVVAAGSDTDSGSSSQQVSVGKPPPGYASSSQQANVSKTAPPDCESSLR